MSFSENTSDSDWKEAKVKVARHINETAAGSGGGGGGKQKYNQRFCEKWLNIFNPWLKRSDDDPNKPYCKVCVCRLDCNRCHLMRHERTIKHKRNLEAFLTNGESAVHKELKVRQERSKYYQQRKRVKQAQKPNRQVEVLVVKEPTEQIVEVVPAVVAANIPIPQLQVQQSKILPEDLVPTLTQEQEPIEPKRSSASSSSNQEGIKLLMQIHQDKNELMESFRELMGVPLTHYPPTKEKNHVDLFFESVSSSVKALSPKLIAEAKMRVSQLICELELRGLRDSNSTNEEVIGVPLTAIIKQSTSEHSQSIGMVQQPHFGGFS